MIIKESFSQIIIIGYGSLTCKVLAHTKDFANKYNYHLIYLEYEAVQFNVASGCAERKGIEHRVINDKVALLDFFTERLEGERTVIISANNNYIFPRNIVERKDCVIINFHNALLPDLPGRNAASWAIYKNYNRTGVTWHYVTSDVDAGDIIIQKECTISEHVKAYELVKKQQEMASEAFLEFFEQLLNNEIVPIKQYLLIERKVYRSDEVPGNGAFSLEDNPNDIYRLLRAMDYGKNRIFPQPKTIFCGREIRILKYRIVSSERIPNDIELSIPITNRECLLLKYEYI